MYDDLVKQLRHCANATTCRHCPWRSECCLHDAQRKAADAIEELIKAAKVMHTWIFLNSVDEQAAYDECGLTDKMNVALGYGGQFVAEMSKEE